MPKDKTELVPVDREKETRRSENAARPVEVGDWYWVTHWKRDWISDEVGEGDPYPEDLLSCVMHVGSNYAELHSVGTERYTFRIHEDDFDVRCRYEPEPEKHLNERIAHHQGRVNSLLNEVKQLTARLGVTRAALPEGAVEEETTALVVAHGTKNIKEHKAALIKAKEKTLPDLFKKIEEEHRMLAEWMKAGLKPHEARAETLKQETSAIEDRIFTVELYAGLIEEMEKIKDGEPAPNDAPIHLFQRRHYMDEECLYDYKAGGMEFRNLRAFERWLLRKKNLTRILPHPRCIVAFRVRRKMKRRHGKTLSDFIHIIMEEKLDQRTFLYIKNGQQVWRLHTGVSFDEELFPHKEDSILLNDEEPLWAEVSWRKPKKVYTQSEYEAHVAHVEELVKKREEEMAAWKKLTKEQKKGRCGPSRWIHYEDEKWEPVTKESVYYDDVMKKIAHEAIAHNRIVVVLQGILDRSPALHPHPPWQLWTQEGFERGLVLVYDKSRALVEGDPPNFKVYCAQLNAELTKGCFTVGQQRSWLRKEAEKERNRRSRDYRYRGDHGYDLEYYKPYGNPGPGDVAKVVRMGRQRQCTFEWYRERLRYSWGKDDQIKARFVCPVTELMNISAYTPGDYKQFYNDPRTRAEYAEWAPWLLTAEDWHAEQAKKAKKGKKK